jgi:diaminopimelate epimerase
MNSSGSSRPAHLTVTKGHGTHNDFILIDDRPGHLELTGDLVRGLANRRGGIGGDGVIRLVASSVLPEGRACLAQDPTAEWFMDYRNADGSLAEMCGNGIRVLAAFAERLGVWDGIGDLPIGTRAGVRRIRKDTTDGWYVADMGPWRVPGGAAALTARYDAMVKVRGLDEKRRALSLEVGNPHTVITLGDPLDVSDADLTRPPVVTPTPPDGSNVELVVSGPRRADGSGVVRMRVHERGVGETQSCGTGACAAALAVRALAGEGAPDVWWVEVPGGTLRVTAANERVELAGPAVLVYDAQVDLYALGGR